MSKCRCVSVCKMEKQVVHMNSEMCVWISINLKLIKNL